MEASENRSADFPRTSHGTAERPTGTYQDPNHEFYQKHNVLKWFWRPHRDRNLTPGSPVAAGRGDAPKTIYPFQPPSVARHAGPWGSADSEGLRPHAPTLENGSQHNASFAKRFLTPSSNPIENFKFTNCKSKLQLQKPNSYLKTQTEVWFSLRPP